MDAKLWIQRLTSPAHASVTLGSALVILGLCLAFNDRMKLHMAAVQAECAALEAPLQAVALAQDHATMFRDLRAQDVEHLKSGFSDTAKSHKTLFESGLSLQEERRLLEKQLDILMTYLLVNPALQRIFLMRGEQPLQSYLIRYIPPKFFGPSAPMEIPSVLRIISKERFAHPERGSADVVDGNLQWSPPQVGTSIRSNALGEFVIFTNGPLILHGPPSDEAAHEQFPHLCLGLDLETARALYRGSFIGTKVILNLKPPEPHGT